MSNREIILLNGKPGSGKSRLGRELELMHHSLEHISVGDTARRIASKAITSWYEHEVTDHLESHTFDPLPDDVAFGIVEEALTGADLAHSILLDGFPRYPAQVEQLHQLAAQTERVIIGAITTDVDDETALKRMLKRGDREITDTQAKQRLSDYHRITEQIQASLAHPYDSYHIDTSGDKQLSLRMGIAALHEMHFAAPEKS